VSEKSIKKKGKSGNGNRSWKRVLVEKVKKNLGEDTVVRGTNFQGKTGKGGITRRRHEGERGGSELGQQVRPLRRGV